MTNLKLLHGSKMFLFVPAGEQHKVSFRSCQGTSISSTASNGPNTSPLLSKAIVMRQEKICSETQAFSRSLG